jgi:hypothetical protein
MQLLRWLLSINALSSHSQNNLEVLRVRLAYWIASAITFLLVLMLMLLPLLDLLETYVLHLVLVVASLSIFFLLRNLFASLPFQAQPAPDVEVAPALAPAAVPVAATATVPLAEGQLKEPVKDIPAIHFREAPALKEREKEIATSRQVTTAPVEAPFKAEDKRLPVVTPQSAVVFKEAFKTVPHPESSVSMFKQWVKVMPQAEATLARSWDDLRRAGGAFTELVERLANSSPTPALAPAVVRTPGERKK